MPFIRHKRLSGRLLFFSLIHTNPVRLHAEAADVLHRAGGLRPLYRMDRRARWLQRANLWRVGFAVCIGYDTSLIRRDDSETTQTSADYLIGRASSAFSFDRAAFNRAEKLFYRRGQAGMLRREAITPAIRAELLDKARIEADHAAKTRYPGPTTTPQDIAAARIAARIAENAEGHRLK